MATGTTAQITNAEQREAFIQTQIDRTRRKVRLIELATGLMTLAAGVLGFFLLAAVIDHWLFPLGMPGRWLALVALIAAAGAFFWQRLWPLLVHAIHPLYAAQVIERGTPTLKNSLLNFLFLRTAPDVVAPAVFETLKRTAAEDLTKVTPDATVDRTQLIRVLYVLTAVLALSACYKIFSPKDPLQTVSRVLLPWADRAAPSRVEILDITPGDIKAKYGARIEITADVRGVRGKDEVSILYSTADQQVVNRELPMRLADDGIRYRAELPPGEEGLLQDLTYRVRAGDALSSQYRIELQTQPLISVQRLEFTYPAYTQRPPNVVEGSGDIEALEGTRVVLRAQANKPIREAFIEWDPDPSSSAARSTLPLTHEGRDASGTFTLELDRDRKRPVHASYQLRFTTEDGEQNESPVVHRITVIPDIAPVVDILNPKKRKIELPENGSQEIEVRAVDPDHGLKQVTLRGTTTGGATWNAVLLDDPAGWQGQYVTKHVVRPQEQGWKAGDTLTYRAVAQDNRQTADGRAAPNESVTVEYQIEIVAPLENPVDSRSRTDSDDPNQAQPPQPMPSEQDPSEPKKDDPKDGTGENQRKPQDDQGQEKPMPGQAESGEGQQDKGKQEQDKQEQDKKDPASSPEMTQPGQDQEQKGKDPQKNPDSKQGQGDQPQQGSPGGEGQPNQGEQGTGQGKPQPGDPSDANGEQGLEEGGAPGASASQTNGARRQGQGSGTPQERPNEDLHDGDVFDIVQRHLERQQQQQNGASAPQRPSDDSARQDGQANQPRGDQPRGDQPPGGDPATTPPTSDSAKPNPQAGQNGTPPMNQPGAAGNERPGQAGSDPQSPSQPAGATPPQDPQAKPQEGAGPGGEKPAQPKPAQPKPAQEQPGPGGAAGQPGEPKQEPKQGATEKPSGESPAGSKPGAEQPGDPKPTSDSTAPAGAAQRPQKPGEPTREPSAADQANDGTAKPKDAQDPAAPGTPDPNSAAGQRPENQQRNGAPGADGDKTAQPSSDESQTAGDSAAGQRAGQPKPDQGAAGKPGQTASNAQGSEEQGTQENPAGTGRPQSGAPDKLAGAPQGPESTPSEGATDSLPMGGGRPGEGKRVEKSTSPPPPPPPEVEPDLNYTRKATDLVLDYLKDQQQSPDQKLLDELGWSQDELAEFVKRWENLKRSANDDAAAKSRLDDALKSLGLRPPRDAVRSGNVQDDARRGNTDAAQRTAPPSKYLEQFNAFRKGAARSEKD